MSTVSDSFTFVNILYTAIGAAVFWGKWGRAELRAYVLSDLISLFNLERKTRAGIECLIFVALGCIVSIGLTAPTSPSQALVAGLGWTGLFTHSATGRA
jgi:hypothetical protein